MGLFSNIYGKNKEWFRLSIEESDEGDILMIYDKNVEKDKFYIYFTKREHKKYYSKDIKDFQIVNQKEIEGFIDHIMGPTKKKIVKISFVDGTNKMYETLEWANSRLKAINFFEKYHNK